ncbi:unnamed protein product [Aspergillus oryzae var. brunneus]|uniref:Superoxide dismutase n=1 Tax=Aspergillus oryzae var. brunneus TaxID=332754 RepID=A0ABQ6L1H7_ASPOZ|nr:unnamed protein product [Aspergillus oryzae]GMG51733.1 unnamed protein product [Aspergillus oryzae var. brunneus]
MEIHHQKHHQTYITNLNAALSAQSTALAANNIPQLINLQQKIKFNGGGHINHSLFWKNLAPHASPETNIDQAAPVLKAAIEAQYGSVEKFKEAFGATLLGLQGSGWGWLVANGPGGKLEIVSTKDQDPVTDKVPVFGVDMWEHAYYLQVSSFLCFRCDLGFWCGWLTAFYPKHHTKTQTQTPNTNTRTQSSPNTHKERPQSYPTIPTPTPTDDCPSTNTVTCRPTIPVSETPRSSLSGNSNSISSFPFPPGCNRN